MPTSVAVALAVTPVAVTLVLMAAFRWGGPRAGPVGWLVAAAIAATAFRTSPAVLIWSQLNGVFLSLFVLYIIWSALFLYRIVAASGAIQSIGRAVSHITGDGLLQVLIFAWVFSAFLEGVAGFGVPLAVVSPLLMGIGVDPVSAVAATAVGHAWSVGLGDLGAPYSALLASSGVAGRDLAPSAACLLGVACLCCGLGVGAVVDGIRGVRRAILPVTVIGLAMAVTQYALAAAGVWSLAGFGAGLAGLVVSVAYGRVVTPRLRARTVGAAQTPPCGRMPIAIALLPYLLVIAVVGLAELVRPVHMLLNGLQLSVVLPTTMTGRGWVTQGGPSRAISVLGHPGALIAYVTAITIWLFRRWRYLDRETLTGVVRATAAGATPASLGILWMVGMAAIMHQSGMTNALAQAMGGVSASGFALGAPLLGVLGTVVTGSTTNSNVLFGGIQAIAGGHVMASPLLALAGQIAGASLGSMLAPAKVIVGCSTTGLAGQEGRVIRSTIVPCFVIAGVVGVILLVADLLVRCR